MTAPSARLPPGLVVAIAVATVMFLGIVGLVTVAAFGGGDPTGAGLEPPIDVDQPATVPGRVSAETSEPASAAVMAGDATTGDAPTTTATPSPVTTGQGITDIDAPAAGEALPIPGSGPVELPVLVTTPPPPATYPAVPLAQLDAATVPELAGWSVVSQDDDHVALERSDQHVDIVRVEATNAGEALHWFYEQVGSDAADLSDSPAVRLGAPSSRFASVAGSQFIGTDTRPQETTTISGSALAAGRAGGDAVLIAISRPGTSSVEQLAADGNLLRAILAHL